MLAFSLAFGLAASEADPVPLGRDFIIRAWRTENGLPDSRVLALLCDRDGFLWIGTRKGLSRFDGTRFHTWSRATHEVFASEECRVITQDRAGVIWVGTAEGLVQLTDPPVRYDPRTIRPDKPRYLSVGSMKIWCLCAPEAGELFVGTSTGMLIRSPDGSWDVPELAWQSGMGPIIQFCVSPDGALWAGATGQLFRRARPGEGWTPQLEGSENSATSCVHGLATTPDGTLHALVGGWEAGLGRLFRYRSGGWERLLDRELDNWSNPLFLKADAVGGLWFPTSARRVGCWHDGRLTEYSLPAELADDVFLSLTSDLEGNLWAGTTRNGLVCLQYRRLQTLGVDDGLPNSSARTLLETADGAWWVGTDAGVVRFESPTTTGRPGAFPAREDTGADSPTGRRLFTTKSGLASEKIRALAEDAQGRVWIGTGDGLNRWDGQQLERVEYPGERYRHKIRALHASRDGSVWVGTAQGLHRFQAGRTNAWSTRDGLPHEDVTVILEDRQGRVWIGTAGGGLARYTDPGFARLDAAGEHSSQRVWALHEDENGVIWIGTDRGLDVLRDGRIAAITTAHGLPDNLVNSVVGDRRGWMWVGHDRGIYRVLREELLAVADGKRTRVRCISYTHEDGLPNPETNGQISNPGAVRRRDGRIAFATMGGVVTFDPAALPDLANGPPAHIEELRAGGRALYSGRPASGVTGPGLEASDQLRVTPQQRGLVDLHFTAVAFRAPDQVQFRYRLLGLSAEWADAGSLRQASYPNLRPGNYTFEVAAVNHHGYPSATPARLSFTVVPIWHERWAVRVVGLVILLATAVALVRWRLAELRRISDLERQAALGRERAQLAKDLHDGLGANLTEITLLSGLGDGTTVPSEALAERFRRLTHSTHEALHSLRSLIWLTNPKADSLEMLVSRLCESSERMLEAAGIRVRVEFPSELPVVKAGPDLRRDVLFAVNEVVHNIVRHAQARQVSLLLVVADHELRLTIQDDGRGFDLAEADGRRGEASHGLGLESLRERLQPHGGVCEIRSQPGQGTEVTFRLPLPVPN